MALKIHLKQPSHSFPRSFRRVPRDKGWQMKPLNVLASQGHLEQNEWRQYWWRRNLADFSFSDTHQSFKLVRVAGEPWNYERSRYGSGKVRCEGISISTSWQYNHDQSNDRLSSTSKPHEHWCFCDKLRFIQTAQTRVDLGSDWLGSAFFPQPLPMCFARPFAFCVACVYCQINDIH